MKKFKIGHTDDSPYYFMVRIYSSKSSMRRTYARWYPASCHKIEAVCCPCTEIHVHSSGKETKKPILGDILIYKKIAKKWAIVSHELLHAAMVYEVEVESNHKKKFELTEEQDCSEERLAYKLTDLMIDYEDGIRKR